MNDRVTPTAPFAKIALPALAGLVLSAFFSISYLATGILCLALMTAAWILQKRTIGSILLWFSIFLFFFTAGEATTPTSRLPANEHVVAVAQINEQPSVRGRWQRTTADIGYFRRSKGSDATWHKANESIQLYVDTCYTIRQGMQLAFRGWLNAIDTTESSYGNLMRKRGFHRRLYLTPGNLLKEARHTSATPAYYASRLQSQAAERLERLSLSDKARAVVSAMVIGDRRYIESDLRQDYNKSGSAHVLSVSGLHVGIVFILINAILYLLPSFRRGHIIKNTAAIICIWLYAAMAGFAPSVIRAAAMASFAQLALATSSQRSTMNIILGSAIVMLSINPNYLTDPSFLLSFSAVLAIIVFNKHLFSPVRTRHRLLNAISGAVTVGLAATIGTAPLVAYWFDNMPVIGILTGPAVILTAYIIVMTGILWLIAPLSIFQGLFSAVLDGTAYIQNRIVEWSSAQKWGIFEGHLPLLCVFLCYFIIFTSGIIIYNRRKYIDNAPNRMEH